MTAQAPTAERELSYRRAINEALAQELDREPRAFIAGVDYGRRGDVFGQTQGLRDRFGPERVLDTPISENAVLGLATGSAATGLRPVVGLMFIDFIGVCFDQILNQMSKMKYMFGGKAQLPITVLVNAGAGGGNAAQHSQSLEALLAHVPGVKVVMPSTPADAKGLLSAAMRDDNPVFFIAHKRLSGMRGPVPEGDYVVPLGKAAVLREGTDCTVVATGYQAQAAVNVADRLTARGVSIEVIDPRTIQPLDIETIVASVRKTHRVVTAHEAVRFAGIGAEINAQIVEEAFDSLDAPPARLGAPFAPVPYSPPLEQAWIVDEPQIEVAVLRVLEG
jgi:pyruvate dehydrogenase E1 component beta subunit